MMLCALCKQAITESRLYGPICGCFPGTPTKWTDDKPQVNDGAKQAHAVAPLDTSKLGPVRVDPDADAVKARIVREALRATGNYHLSIAAGLCDDAALVKLFMLLKS